MESSAPFHRSRSIFGKRLIELHSADRMVHISDTMSPCSVQDNIHVLGTELLTKHAISCVVN